MKKLKIYFSIAFVIVINFNAFSQTDQCMILKRKPVLSDSIYFPKFKGEYENIYKMIKKELDKTPKYQNERYFRMFFSISIDETGQATSEKIMSVSKNARKYFDVIHPNILNFIKDWNPAINSKTQVRVKYSLNFEIEFIEKKITLVIFNNNYERIYE